MTKEEIAAVLAEHRAWLDNNDGKRARRLQQRGQGGRFGAAHGGIIAGHGGAVRIGGAMPISGRFQRAGV